MKILITGGSGYVGTMLADRFASRDDVEAILLIDKEPFSPFIENHPARAKISFIQANISEDGWQEQAKDFAPDIVIHAAWQIREMYGKRKLQWKWNVEGSVKLFGFALSLPSVKKLIHFSTVASYGAYPDNSIDHFFKEEEPFRKTDYLYAEEKRIVEESLKEKHEARKKEGGAPQVIVIRPASITGSRIRKAKKGINLQSALSGFLAFVPVTPKWLRQFIHEDDVVDILELCTFSPIEGDYEIFNLCPPGKPVLGKDMADAVKKKTISVKPWMMRIAFFFAWHISRGRIPTSRGGWKSYSYPIAVDGSKVTKVYGYQYKYDPKEAFLTQKGRYGEIKS